MAHPIAGGVRNRKIGVVIIDDHAMFVEGLAILLTADGDLAVTGIAGTSADGLREVAQQRPDVVVLDDRLPDGSGADCIAAMLAICPGAKVLLITTDDSDDVLERAIRSGAAGVISKRRSAAFLVEAVRAAGRGEPVLAPEVLRRFTLRLSRGTSAGKQGELTPKEQQVLGLLVAGSGTAELARVLVVAPATVRNHIRAIMVKLGAHSRLEVRAIAARDELVRSP